MVRETVVCDVCGKDMEKYVNGLTFNGADEHLVYSFTAVLCEDVTRRLDICPKCLMVAHDALAGIAYEGTKLRELLGERVNAPKEV